MPNKIPFDEKKLIEKELKYWKLTSLVYELATSEHFLKMEKILNSKPNKAGNVAAANWKDKMSPLSVTEIIVKSN